MYIVWGRRWLLVLLPCTCIAAYMVSAVVRYYIYSRSNHFLKAPADASTNLHSHQPISKTPLTIY
jgi:hypothetical protein